jgi:hypothetical protein
VNALSAEYLTDVLKRCGALGSAQLREVSVKDRRQTILSEIVRLQLVYDGKSANAPQQLVLKTTLPERLKSSWNAGHNEVAFYTTVAPATREGLLPRCFDAISAGENTPWHILLEDLTDTHRIPTVWPLPPQFEECVRIIEARARFHAAWWDDARFGKEIGKWSTPEEIDAMLERFAARFAAFADRLGDVLTRERRQLYERLLADAARLNARYLSHRNVTIVHGDGHFWNCFVPKNPERDDVRFFDWDCWRVDVGCDDLAYMLAMHWYPDRRRRFERLLLDRYHDTLVSHGVRNYDRNALQDDYRLSVLWQITTPVWQAAYDIPPRIWWNNFERIMMAVDDLDCRELLSA